jgi:hypothetical protein
MMLTFLFVVPNVFFYQQLPLALRQTAPVPIMVPDKGVTIDRAVGRER